MVLFAHSEMVSYVIMLYKQFNLASVISLQS